MSKEKMEGVVKILRERSWTIGTMESCTGGAIADCITNIPGVSDVFRDGRVTYCNEAKIKAGVSGDLIERYGVASKEVAEEMARKIEGEIGIGVTGNLPGKVFMAVRMAPFTKATEDLNMKDTIISEMIETRSDLENIIEARIEMKKVVVEKVVKMIFERI